MDLYALITWPEVQDYQELEGFDEHSCLADAKFAGSGAYFVEKDWLDKVNSAGND